MKAIKKCRVCGSENLIPILSLGNQCVTNFIDDPSKEPLRGPLELVLCNEKTGGCGLLQLKHSIDHDILYRKYWYKSGISTTMVKALEDIVKSIEKMVNLKEGDIVIDVGSNDGTLLRHYNIPGLVTVGFEPSNLWELGVEGVTKTIHDYFNYDTFNKEFSDKAKVITSIAMFYDLEEPNKFVEDIKKCLDKDGIWIIQMNYLGLMLENNTFDNISHEHLEYYSFLSLENLLKKHDMEVIDAETNDVNGGSFRIYIKHKEGNIKPFPNAKERLKKLRKKEKEMGMGDKKVYNDFAERIEKIKESLISFLKEEKKNGKKVYIYGASTRGLVVLEYCAINNGLIEYAVDKNEDKKGKYIVGSGIKILSLEEYRKNLPDYLFVLPFQFKREIAHQEIEFLKNGGKMIFALPNFEIIDKEYLNE